MTSANRGQQAQRRRSLILAAAGVLFARSDASGATMADVARHAGVAVGTLYKFFPSKQALHLALLLLLKHGLMCILTLPHQHQP